MQKNGPKNTAQKAVVVAELVAVAVFAFLSYSGQLPGGREDAQAAKNKATSPMIASSQK